MEENDVAIKTLSEIVTGLLRKEGVISDKWKVQLSLVLEDKYHIDREKIERFLEGDDAGNRSVC
jgi:hypothetical protein